PHMSVRHNLTLASLASYCRAGWIDRSGEARAAEAEMRSLAVRASGSAQHAVYLSGGNQQKVLIARALLCSPDVLILDEPTRGIDIGARAEIYAIIRSLAASGKAVVLVSSEMPEILTLSHRILVMRGGVVTAQLDAAEATAESVLHYAMAS